MNNNERFTKDDMRKDLEMMTKFYLERLTYITENVPNCDEELSNAKGLVKRACEWAIEGLEKGDN